jgi:hypothetical protein
MQPGQEEGSDLANTVWLYLQPVPAQRHESAGGASLGSLDSTAGLQDRASEQEFMLGERVYHADDHVVGQYYIALADKFSLPEALKPVQETFDFIIENASNVSLNHSVEGAALLRCLARPCSCHSSSCSPPLLHACPACTARACPVHYA